MADGDDILIADVPDGAIDGHRGQVVDVRADQPGRMGSGKGDRLEGVNLGQFHPRSLAKVAWALAQMAEYA